MGVHDEEDLPILDAVVRGGDEAIILSMRLGRETLAELEALHRAVLEPEDGADGHGPVALGASAGRVPRPGAGDGSAVRLDAGPRDPGATAHGRHGDGRGERRRDDAGSIDVLLERHVDRLRRELRELLVGDIPSDDALDA